MTDRSDDAVLDTLQGFDISDTDEQKMQRLLLWLEEHGATVPAVNVAFGDDRRGVYSTRAISPGELVMHIPRKLIITTEIAKDSAVGKVIKTHNANVSEYGYIAAFLLQLKREGGFWKPYVDVLPESFPDHPLFFTPSELEYLKGSYTLPMIEEQRNWLGYEAQQVLNCLPKGQAFTPLQFAWARCVVMTRVYTVTIQEKKSLGLVPLADMLNHAAVADVAWTGESTFGFSIFSEKQLDAGIPVLESYGKRCNGRLFVHHGFCIDDNPENECELDFPALEPTHPFYPYVNSDHGQLRDELRLFKVTEKFDAPVPRAMFSYLRLACMDDLPSVYGHMAKGHNAAVIPPISRANEIGALTALAAACERALARFDTTYEEDEVLLRAGNLPRRLQYAVKVRMGEKKIMRHYLNMARLAIPVLRDSTSDLAAFADQPMPHAAYFAELIKYLGRTVE